MRRLSRGRFGGEPSPGSVPASVARAALVAAALGAGGLLAAGTYLPVEYSLSETLVSPNSSNIASGPMGQVGKGFFGGAMAQVGDVDGDGTTDLLVGAEGEIAEDTDHAGRAYLVSGADRRVIRSFASPDPEVFGSFGGAVAGPGDVDGDGTPDLAIGASGESVEGTDGAGRVYLYGGANGDLLRTLRSPDAADTGAFGVALAPAGDVDGDGTGDLLVGAQQEPAGDTEDAGRAYLVSGADGGVLRSFATPNPERYGLFGGAVAGVGDVSGDGTPDVAVGAHEEAVADRGKAGRAYVLSGADGRVLRTLRSPNPQEGGFFGESVAGIGDVDGDGTGEVAVGAPAERAGRSSAGGRVYLFDGESGELLRSATSPAAEGAQFGRFLDGVGDVSGDGSADLLIGAPGEPVDGTAAAGRAYLVSGADGAVLRAFSTPRPSRAGRFGNTVVGGGDLDGDGRGDVVVGAREEMVDSLRAGRAYVYESGGGGK